MFSILVIIIRVVDFVRKKVRIRLRFIVKLEINGTVMTASMVMITFYGCGYS